MNGECYYDIYNGNCIDVMSGLPKHSIDLILTDPPYSREYQHLYGEMAQVAKSILKIGGSLVTLCGHYQVPDVMNDISEHLRYWWIGGMHHRTIHRMPGKWVNITWKPALWFVNERRRKGDTECPIDMLNDKGKDKKYHKWGQNVHWFHHWVERLCPEYGIVLDPFVGGGTTAEACILIGNCSFIGIDISNECCDTTIKRIDDVLQGERK